MHELLTFTALSCFPACAAHLSSWAFTAHEKDKRIREELPLQFSIREYVGKKNTKQLKKSDLKPLQQKHLFSRIDPHNAVSRGIKRDVFG